MQKRTCTTKISINRKLVHFCRKWLTAKMPTKDQKITAPSTASKRATALFLAWLKNRLKIVKSKYLYSIYSMNIWILYNTFYRHRQQYLYSQSQIEMPIMDSDKHRKLAIAQTRYMDKQSIGSYGLKEPPAAGPRLSYQQQQQQFLQLSNTLKSSAVITTPALNKDYLRNCGEVSTI